MVPAVESAVYKRWTDGTGGGIKDSEMAGLCGRI